MRNYLLTYDTGHDFGEMEFSSNWRLNSKGNVEDAKKALRSKLGKRAYNYSIKKIERLVN